MGWIVGVFSTIFLIFLFSFDIIGVFIWFPLGLSIGVLQSLELRQWNIKSSSWIWITAFGWWTISFYFDVDAFDFPELGPIILLIVLGALLGVCQALIIRKVFTRSGLWVLLTTLGVCALVFIQFHLLFPPYSYHPTFFEKLIYQLFAESNPSLYDFLTTFTEEISIVVFPFVGALTTAVPTGVVLAKSIGSKSRDETSSIVSIAG